MKRNKDMTARFVTFASEPGRLGAIDPHTCPQGRQREVRTLRNPHLRFALAFGS